MKIGSVKHESLLRKLVISFFFMSIIPILFILYLLKLIGFDVVEIQLPYVRWTVGLITCLVFVCYLLLRFSMRTISRIMKDAGKIADGDYKSRLDIEESNEIGSLAKSFNKITGELEQKIEDLQESKALIQDIFNKVGSALSSTGGIDQLLALIMQTIARGVLAESGCIMLLDKDTNKLQVKVSYGLEPERGANISVNTEEGIIGIAVKEKRMISSLAPGTVGTKSAEASTFSYRNILCVPLLHKDDCLGIMAVFNKTQGIDFTNDDKILLNNVASQAAVAIANAQLNEDVERTYIETITALAMAVEAKDPYSRGHLDRVSRLVVKLGEHMGLDREKIELLKNGAELHDIGKIGVRDALLRKKTSLTDQETKEIEQHVIIGENIMKPVRGLLPLCGMARHHQEKFDGTGYPDGLKGEDIPFEARLLKVVDAYDAMVTDRPYRKALGKEQAKEQLAKYKGTEFDPEIVDKFLEII